MLAPIDQLTVISAIERCCGSFFVRSGELFGREPIIIDEVDPAVVPPLEHLDAFVIGAGLCGVFFLLGVVPVRDGDRIRVELEPLFVAERDASVLRAESLLDVAFALLTGAANELVLPLDAERRATGTMSVLRVIILEEPLPLLVLFETGVRDQVLVRIAGSDVVGVVVVRRPRAAVVVAVTEVRRAAAATFQMKGRVFGFCGVEIVTAYGGGNFLGIEIVADACVPLVLFPDEEVGVAAVVLEVVLVLDLAPVAPLICGGPAIGELCLDVASALPTRGALLDDVAVGEAIGARAAMVAALTVQADGIPLLAELELVSDHVHLGIPYGRIELGETPEHLVLRVPPAFRRLAVADGDHGPAAVAGFEHDPLLPMSTHRLFTPWGIVPRCWLMLLGRISRPPRVSSARMTSRVGGPQYVLYDK